MDRMIELAHGNLLKADVQALVNTVNCIGFMGKGIALQFKQAYPDNFRVYERACKAEEVRPGRMLTVPTGELTGPRFIVNFPTKRHWRGKSLIEDIDAGLDALVEEVRRLKIASIAVPPLGCGNGGLRWSDVRPRIQKAFAALPEVRVLLFEPRGGAAAQVGAVEAGVQAPLSSAIWHYEGAATFWLSGFRTILAGGQRAGRAPSAGRDQGDRSNIRRA